MKNQNKKLAKVLAATIWGVGFVTPLVFDNITEAANFGKGETNIITTDAEITAGNGTKWAKNHNHGTTAVDATNSVALLDKNGDTHLFKIVAASGTGTSAVLTLWSYDSTFGTTKFNNSGGGNAYSGSVLESKAEGLATGILSNLKFIPYTSASGDDTPISGKTVWIPSKTELQDSGTWGLTSNKQRAIGGSSWLRSPYPGSGNYAYSVYSYGGIYNDVVAYADLLCPALQISNQQSFVFSAKAAIPTNGNFKVDAETGGVTEYQMAISDAFTVSGITLDGDKIKVTTSNLPAGWKLTGLLTAETDSTKNDTWAHLNGPSATSTSTKGISYMAQADSNGYFHPTNEQLSGKALKLFGMKNIGVTELSDKAITGLSIVDSKLHMQVKDNSSDSSKDGVNSGIPLILKNGVTVKLVGNASNNITLEAAADTAKLNLQTYTHSGTVNNEGTLTVEGTGSFQPGADSINRGTIELSGGTLGSEIDNAGTIKLGNGAALAGKYVLDGTLEFTESIATNVGYLSDGTNLVDEGATLTLLDEGTVSGIISGKGYVTVGDGTAAKTVTATVDQLANTGKITVAANATLELTSGTLTKTINNDANGTVKLNGANLGAGANVTAGTLKFAADTTVADASYLATTNTIDSGKTLTLLNGTLGGTLSGEGNVVIGDGTARTVVVNAEQLGNTGTLSVLTYGTMEITAGTLNRVINNEGTVKFTGTSTAVLDAGYITGNIVIDSDKTLTLMAGTLAGTITGAGNIAIGDGTIQSVKAGVNQLNNDGAVSVAGNGTLELTGGTLTKAISNNGTIVFNGAGLNTKITSGALKFSENTTVADAGYIAATTNIIDSGKTLTLSSGTLGGILSGEGNVKIAGAVSIDASKLADTLTGITVDTDKALTLTGGNLLSAIDNNGIVTVAAGATGTVIATKSISGGTVEVVSGTLCYSGNSKLGNVLKINNNATLDLDAGVLADDITNNSNLYLSGGTLATNIKGSGTTYLKKNATTNTGATVTVLTDRTISGSVNATGVTTNTSTIKMTSNDSSSAINTLTINNALSGTVDLQIDVDMSSFAADKLVVTNIDGATVNLTNINVTKDIVLSTMDLPKSEPNKITYVTSGGGTATYQIKGTSDGSIISLTNGYKYTFTKGTEEGKLNYRVDESTATFKQFVEGKLGASTFNLTGKLENSGTDIAKIEQGDKTPLYLNLNGLNLTSTTSSIVTIGTGKTFNVNGGNATNAGTTDANTKFNVSGGTLNVSGKTTMSGDLTNSGTVNMDGTTTINGTITNTAGTMTVTGVNKLNGTVTNSGTMNVAGNTDIVNITNNAGGNFNASGTTTFTGTTENAGTMTITSGVTNFKGAVTNSGAGVLTTGGKTTFGAGVTNSATMNLDGSTTVNGAVTNTGTFNNNGTTVLNAKLSGAGTYTNSGTLNVADAANLAMTSITNTGTIKLGQATVSVLGAIISGGNISIVGDVDTTADKLAGSATVAAGKNLTITGGNISGTIGGAGNLIISTAPVTNTNKKGLNAATLEIRSSLDTEVDTLNIASGITNNGTLTISGDGTSTDTLKNNITGDTGSMNISGTITVQSDKTITQQDLTVNSGSKLTANTDNLAITNGITNSGELVMNKGTSTETLNQVINGGNVTLNNGVKFDNDNLVSVGTLTVDNAIYNFNATLNGATITVDQISVTGKASGTLQLGTINITGTSTSTDWSTGVAKTVQYLNTIDPTSDITVANNSYVTLGMFGYNFSQAKTGETIEYGKLTVLKTFAYTLHQAVVAENEAAGSIETYYLTGDYTETQDLGVLKAYGTDDGRTFTIDCSNFDFAGGGRKGITLNNSKDELNLANIKKISGWADSGVVENNVGTVNITNTATTTLNSKLVGAGKYNLTENSTLKVEDLRNLAMNSITNKGTMEIGNSTEATVDDQLTAVIKGGSVKLQGDIFTTGEKLADDNSNNMDLNLNGHTLNISNGDLAVQVGSATNKAGTLHIAGTANTTATKAIYTAVNNEGNLTTEANNLMNTVENKGTLELTAGTLNKAITNSGTVKLNGAALGGAYVTAGTLEFAKDITVADASYVAAATNIIDETKTLTLSQGILGGNVTGDGNIVIGDGTVQTVKTTVAQLGNTGKLTVANNGTLELTEGTLAKAVTNNGTVKLNGATMDSERVKEGTIEFAKNLTINGEYISNAEKVIDENVNLTVNGGILTNNITGDGTLIVPTGTELVYKQTNDSKIAVKTVIEKGARMAPVADAFAKEVENHGTLILAGGNLSGKVTNYANTSTMEVTAHINMAEGGKVVQQAGSNLIVPVEVIESAENNSSRALFQGITKKEQLDVGAGNLTVTGQVKDGYYYVLASGTAIDGVTLTENDLWKLENVKFTGIIMADYEIKYNTNTATNPGSIALHVNVATTIEEGNTSGLAAVQQGNISIAKEFTGEVENHLSLVHRSTIKQQNEAKLRNVLNEKTKFDTDNLAPEVIETGKVEEIMPVQVKEKEIYDKEIWASYVNSKETTEGMKLGAELKGDNTAKYDGTVVGLDFHSGKHSITGMAVSYSKGDINSYSNNTTIRNKAKYYGVSFYDRIASGNTAVIYDIGYVKGNNEINQFYGGKDFTAEVDSDTYTAGIRLEAALGSTKNRVVPFAAFRYMQQNNKDYTNSHKTQFDVQNQNLYIPKAGIAWTGEFTAPNSVCTWRPSIEAGYIWNLGDRTANSTVYAGTRVTPINYDVVDKSSFYGKLGLEFMAKNFTAGVFYRYLKGNAVKNNKWNVNMSWAF